MAPGTGKTYTSLAIAEELLKKKNGVFRVLYLVPSIQLLSQTLRGWNGDVNFNMDSIAVCSDRKVTKVKGANELEDIAASDIGFPATTDYKKLLEYKEKIEAKNFSSDMLTVFSTYQSIDVLIEAQKHGFYEFDLVICDEAHRTTGSTELNKEESSFTKVHRQSYIKAAKRLYQTATPRVYGEDAKKKAQENSVVIADMSDSELYGEEFYRIGFGDAVRKGILTDYKVMILAVDEDVVAKRFQQILANEKELKFDDVTKIIGCWNGLVKRKGNTDQVMGKPMKRAIAFTGTIKESERITKMFEQVVDEYLYETDSNFSVQIQHADGSMNALQKNEKISWLKSEVPENTCRILSNARFLTEGVDIPDLDAVMFLKPRKSKIDIAQAVGRVMRKADDKEYGYVILPIGVPAGVDENNVLDSNENYAVVWEVLNALRSIDERFDSMINKLELNKKKPTVIGTTSVGDPPTGVLEEPEEYQIAMDFSEWTDLERAIYGKIVNKVGNVRYWEDWSKDVAKIARQHMVRISAMLEDTNSTEYKEFQKFLKELRYNLNGSITAQQAIEMLAQHMITKPVFEALFDSYEFVKNNPISISMEVMLNLLGRNGFAKEQEELEGFYESVKVRAEGIDNLEGKQKIIIQLYDKFFRVGFKETTERLGIVFTPTEVVDFIIHSVDEVLQKHFGKSLGSEGIHVLDPFTGTGTFVTRLLQSGLISKEDLLRKYTQEIHANEIVLLSYYIAAINIEETFHSITKGEYTPFKGIVLTDTFESLEQKQSFASEIFGENNTRLKKQQEKPIFAIIGNPPYSARQRSENDNNENISYPFLDSRIADTYAKFSKANALHTLYDSYIKAFRWATDRLGHKGVVGFITASSYIDKTSTDGLRKCLSEDYNYIYVYNLRGAIRGKSKIDAKKEGQNVFDILTGVAIIILVKDGSYNHEIYYSEMPDYLTKNEKLQILREEKSILGKEWNKIVPDSNNDWINQRDKNYLNYMSLEGEAGAIFNYKSLGIQTKRDKWVYNFSTHTLFESISFMVENYNKDVTRLEHIKDKNSKLEQITLDKSKISWSDELKRRLAKGEIIDVDNKKIVISQYRPFTKKYLYYDRALVARPGKFDSLFKHENKVIMITGPGARKGFSVIVADKIPESALIDNGQVFPMYLSFEDELFDEKSSNIKSGIKDKLNVNEDELFAYIYGILHSSDYRNKYKNDLSKGLPRIPIIKNKDKFIEVGKKLLDLHLNYEKVEISQSVEVISKNQPSYLVKQMKFANKNNKNTINFNSDISIKNIPDKAYEYEVNGKSAIEWIMDQYREKQDKESKIIDDPNLYSVDEKYIFNLLLRIINVSVQTVDLMNSLPALDIVE